MKFEGYFKWLFTRWYYWTILILLVIINSEIRTLFINQEIESLIGYLFGMVLILALIFYVFYFTYKKGFEDCRRKLK